MKKQNIIRDVSHLPTHQFGPKNPAWWGAQGFILIEGLASAFGVATYLYLYNQNKSWPLGPQPGLLYSSLMLGLLLLAEIPNMWLKKAASKHDLKKVQKGLIVMSLIGVLAIILRCFEFTQLNVKWDENAYGSIIWFILGFHTVHLVTDIVETWVMTIIMFIGPIDMRRFPEIEDNQDYWHFVLFLWIGAYILLYWIPRWFEVLP
jgi:cytochrome c oxidase subunit 3